MKRFNPVIGAVCVLLIFVVAQNSMAVEKVSRQEETGWLRWVIPLPKKISISGKVEVPAKEVKITVRRGASDTEKTAADQLSALFKEKSNTIDGQAFDAGGKGKAFEILIGVCDARGKIEDVTVPGAADLAGLPNSEQAYRIHPVNDTQLVLTALDERGVYYAAQTLCQLLEDKFSDGKVTIPLVSVTDWPDMEQRGEWGGLSWFPPDEIEWLARHKMNMVVYHVGFHIGEDGRGEAPNMHPERIAAARRKALDMVPIITHYSTLGEFTNLFEVYPHLNKGKAEPEGKVVRDLGEADVKTVPCPSEPRMVEVLADVMCAMAKAGAIEIDCWLTEGRGFQCPCEKCLAEGENMHYALETRAYINAWRLAQKQYPKLFARILLTQGTYRTNDKVLAEVPPGVGVVFYASSWTYNSLRAPMIYPLLEEFAAKGGWLGVVPQLTASFGAVTPWTGPQFIRYRMNEFVDKKLKCLNGYAVYSNRLYDFNVTAAAEWSWNAKGRDEREFATAYATRRGISDPDAFAEWAMLLGPVGWDFYGAAMYDFNASGKLVNMVAARTGPGLGKKGMFEYFPTTEHFDKDLAACDKAMKIAERLGKPGMIAETRVIQGYVSMMKAIAFITTQIAAVADKPTWDERVELQNALTRLGVAGLETIDGLEAWERSLGLDLMTRVYGRYAITKAAVSRNVYGISDALRPFGIRGFESSYFRKKVGAWKSKDFKAKTKIRKTWDVTDHVRVAGIYEVTFKNASHFLLDMTRAALATAPAEQPEQLTELSVDAHQGRTAYRSNKAHVYTLTLDRLDPGRRYFLVADIEGHPAELQGGRMKHCKGGVWMRAVRPADADPQSLADVVLPLTDAEWALATLPQFTGKGLRVGVVQKGYGSTEILNYLQTVDGIDAQPLTSPNKAMIDACEVVVLPILPRDDQGQRMSGSLMDTFRNYVRGGGGLIITAALSKMGLRRYPDICKFKNHGGGHDFAPWMVVDEHPLTQGIEMNTELPGTGFCVEYELGAQGVAVAISAQSRDPVVVVGEFGKGRLVACGLDLRLKGNSTQSAKAALLKNAVKWCAGKQ